MFWNLIANEILAEIFPPDVHLQAFADDFVFHIYSRIREGLKILAQQALDIFKTLTDKNELQISTSKSEYMLIGRLLRGPTIKWGTESIKRSLTIKYLGIILDEKLNWAAHIKHQGNKAVLTYQRLARIAGATWGLKQEHQRIDILYSTVAEDGSPLCCSLGAEPHIQSEEITPDDPKEVYVIHHRSLSYSTNSCPAVYNWNVTSLRKG
ncbi:hypothetical protein AVEN_243650-1 [Araneus ventricosus]|uniref:Reverse transcriptase domain-containing protein n=1 Tax=Araneus ventricosus TaxID=182803 RepID=A0A4Y2A7A0_ARAVE|nr:hypothetical protein AVEN_243650-1 [Araneus ventricosus]